MSVSGDAIPDSAAHQWRFDEGSGSTVTDAISSNDGSISGANWISGNQYVGGFALDFDGVDDEITFDVTNNLDKESPSGFTMALSIEFGSLSSRQRWFQQYDSNEDLAVGMQITDSGVIAPMDRDNDLSGATDQISSGELVRLCMAVDGFNNVTWYIDGNDVTNTTSQDNGPTSSDESLRIGADVGSDAFGGVIDNPIIYNEELSSEEAEDDYNIQPWS